MPRTPSPASRLKHANANRRYPLRLLPFSGLKAHRIRRFTLITCYP